MKKINLAITGCLGRMGKQLIKSSRKDKNFKIVALTENKKVNKKINGIKLDQNNEQTFKNAHVIIIDFSSKMQFSSFNKLLQSLRKSNY